ncbi:polyprenyl synthetase family protein [Robertmurraya sp. P23]|uniref:polyprenyl synthetase family protein n=1 Tax=Robertmurraya sp. P23 TaxID=3436931 RepID=UPI003D96205A
MVKKVGFTSFSKKYKELVEAYLNESVSKLTAPSLIKEAMLYSLEAGGKRIRPLLLFATLEAFGKKGELGLEAAAAIEMIHTYSLIHDDLPSMDNDDLRRGKPTNHKVFGEAYAILAGDALLTYSFQVISSASEHIPAEVKIQLITELAKASGAEGMVGGQVADMDGEGKDLSLNELEYIHIHKTGKLLAYSVVAGAMIAGANTHQLEKFATFAHHLGLAFQIRDDILDLEGDEEIIGKKVGSDEQNNKSTYPSLLTMEGARQSLLEHISLAKDSLNSMELETDILKEITDLVANRNH